jgi:hypothetical protein
MGYYTSTIRVLRGALHISNEKLKEFEEKFGYSIERELRLKEAEGGVRQITHLPRGECGLNHELPDFLRMTEGVADVLVVWEGGDHINGFFVNGGVVEEMDVEFVFKLKEC